MFIILFFAAAFFVFLNFSCINYFKEADSKFRSSIIQTLIFISAFIFISTELLSLFNAVNSSGIIITWSVLLLLSSILNWIRWDKHFPHMNLSVGVPTDRNAKIINNTLNKFLFYSTCFILIITLTTALVASPNNWDSMTYHLSRVMHWIQNENVNFYPTQIDRQLTQPPFAEYFILHLQLLNGSDRFANIVQWCFF